MSVLFALNKSFKKQAQVSQPGKILQENNVRTLCTNGPLFPNGTGIENKVQMVLLLLQVPVRESCARKQGNGDGCVRHQKDTETFKGT